jgi:hypothetical protein
VLAMPDDLSPFYGASAEQARAGLTRAVFAQVRQFHQERAATMARVKMNCRDCQMFSSAGCSKHEAMPPDDFIEVGCDAWQWDEVPF